MRVLPILLAVLAGACSSDHDGHPVEGAQREATVPGVQTAVAAVGTVRDAAHGFGAVVADAEPAEVREARTSLAEAAARQQLAGEQVARLRALGAGSIAPRKELDAALAEQAAAAAVATRARQALAAFGAIMTRVSPGPSAVWVLAQVTQADVTRIAKGAPARFRPDALRDDTFEGTVDEAPTYVDPVSRTAPVRLRLADAAGVLRPGMTGAAAIAAGDSRDAVVVPAGAVVFDGAQPIVFVERAGRYLPRPVRLGVVEDGRIELRDGVEAGERVVTVGAASLLSAARLPASGADED